MNAKWMKRQLILMIGALIFSSLALTSSVNAQEGQKLTVAIGRLPWGALNSPITQHMIRNKLIEACPTSACVRQIGGLD